MKPGLAVSAIALLLVLSGCATTAPPEVPAKVAPAGPQTLDGRLAARGYRLGASLASVPNLSFDGWNYLDDQHLLFRLNGATQDILVTLAPGCLGLDQTIGVAFSTQGPVLTPRDELIYRVGTSELGCPISGLYQLQRVGPQG